MELVIDYQYFFSGHKFPLFVGRGFGKDSSQGGQALLPVIHGHLAHGAHAVFDGQVLKLLHVDLLENALADFAVTFKTSWMARRPLKPVLWQEAQPLPLKIVAPPAPGGFGPKPGFLPG